MLTDYITLTEAARKTTISYRTLFRAIHAGRLPATRFGVDWCIRIDELNAFVEARRRKAGVVISHES